MTKQQLRAHYLQKRKTLSLEQIDAGSIAIANNLLQLDIWDFKNYHLFLSIEKHKEVQTEYILNILMGKDKNVIISKSNFDDYSMTHYLLTDQTEIKVNRYGIPEPVSNDFLVHEEQMDVVFVPLLAYDLKGHRIGYGKGFYDRFLGNCRPNAKRIGLSFFEPHTVAIPSDTHDLKLDAVVTPDKIRTFT